jgi:hypothetical protein
VHVVQYWQGSHAFGSKEVQEKHYNLSTAAVEHQNTIRFSPNLDIYQPNLTTDVILRNNLIN